MALSAMGDEGKPVDWWFMYKVAGESTTSEGGKGPVLHGKKVTGAEYVYFDASMPKAGKLSLSPNTVQGGALLSTLDQVYRSMGKSVGWWFYNDENPLNGKVNSERGHTKGVVAFDLSSNTAFWLIQSTPKFPTRSPYAFPKTGERNAQTLLCITLQDATVAQSIAKQMYVAQQPNVYLASEIPSGLSGAPNDARTKLMKDLVASGNTPVHTVVPFRSRAGVKFMSIAKNRTWDLDFYNDLVGPTLKENLDVETWEHDPVPPSEDSDKRHTVVGMKDVNLGPLGIDVAWSEEDDHAKLAISARSERLHYVCVGDINYTMAQRKRGGGTVAFQCEPLWSSLASILQDGSKVAPTARTSRTAKASGEGTRTRGKRLPTAPGQRSQTPDAGRRARP